MKLFSPSFDPNYPNLKQSLFLAVLFFIFGFLFWMTAYIPLLIVSPLPETYLVFLHSLVSPVCVIPLIIYVSRKSGILFKWELKSPVYGLCCYCFKFCIVCLRTSANKRHWSIVYFRSLV